MHDTILDQHLDHCRQLLKNWQHFHMFISECKEEGKTFGGEDEARFLKVKSQIAILFDSFFESITDRNREVIATAQSILTVVENSILLRTVQRMSVAELKKMEIEWHEAYLLVNSIIGMLEEEQARLAKISPTKHRLEIMGARASLAVKSFVHSRALHFTLVLIGILTVAVGLPMFGIFNYDFLNKYPSTKKVYQVGRYIMRKSAMPNLEYQSWDAFLKYAPLQGPPDFGKIAAPGPIQNQMNTIMPGLLAGSEQIGKYRLQHFAKGDQNATVAYALVKSTLDAKRIESEGPKILDGMFQNPDVRKVLVIGRVANAIFLVRARTEQDMQMTLSSLPK
ncbi:hypothetical protein HQ520_03800 [bacterium]|nr:hypothetical protein [bacterium]